MKKATNDNEICVPTIIGKTLSFKTRFFLIKDKVAEIISTNNTPHEIEFRWNGKKYTYSAEKLKEHLKLK